MRSTAVVTFFLIDFFISIIFIASLTQKSYTKKGKARAAAKQRLANGNSNGHITHDINHNETKPEEEKKEN